MKPSKQYSAIVASVLLILPAVAYADTGSSSSFASQLLQIQMNVITCRNTYATGFLNDVVTVINNSTITSTLSGTDIPKLNSDYSALQGDASANNTSQFKTDVKTYNTDTNTANKDSRTAIIAAHSKTVNSTLRTDLAQLKSTHNSCILVAKQQDAQLKEQRFNNAMTHTQNWANRMGKHGENMTALNQTISRAGADIQAFETAVNNAQNGTQLKNAMKSFCLYNGCNNSNDFHFAANTAIEADQAKLNLLASKNSTATYQSIVSQAQTDLNNAQTALSQVGSSQYQGNQSSTIWTDIKAADDLISQLQMMDHKH